MITLPHREKGTVERGTLVCSVSELQGKPGSRCDCTVMAVAAATATTAFVIGAALYYRLFVTAATREEISTVAFFYGVTGMLVGIGICFLVKFLDKRGLSTAKERRLLREARTTQRTTDPDSPEHREALVTLGKVPAHEDTDTVTS